MSVYRYLDCLAVSIFIAETFFIAGLFFGFINKPNYGLIIKFIDS